MRNRLKNSRAFICMNTFATFRRFGHYPERASCLRNSTDLAVPWAIATSGRMESARPTLDLLSLDPNVIIITRDQVRFAKPDPDLFLAAAERLGVDIESSIVVGDSVWDQLAARRARALGVGLLSGGYGQDELERAGAYRVYNDPADLLRSSRRGRRAYTFRFLDDVRVEGCF